MQQPPPTGRVVVQKRFSKIFFTSLTVLILACLFVVPVMGAEIPAVGGALTSGTYTLTEDVTLTGALTIASGGDVVIDLNGHTLSFTSSSVVTIITNKGTLTIQDTSADQQGSIDFTFSKSSSTMYGINNNGGTLNFESGKITITRTAGTSTVYGIYSGTINMIGGELEVAATSQVSTVNGISSAGTISDGKIKVSTAKSTGTANVVSNVNTVISGGTFDGKSVSAKVTGGTFNFDPSATVPPYKYTVTENEGTWTVSEAVNPENHIDVDGTGYVNFDDAVAAMSGTSTIKLLMDYDTGTMPITIPAGTEATLDLNGNTLSGSGTVIVNIKSESLTIKDSAGGGKIDHTYTGSSKMYTIYSTIDTKITLESGAIHTSGTASTYTYGIYNEGENSIITIDGGSIIVESEQSNTYGIKADDGKLVMNKGTIDVTAVKNVYGLSLSGNGSEMKGGTVTATSKTSTAYGIFGDGTISGGTVKASVDTAGKSAYVASSTNARITGGTFEGSKVSAQVTGGTFNFDPVAGGANIPAFTHKVTKEGGYWTVSEVPANELPANIEVDDQQFVTFELAKDAIVSGSTIKLLQDYDGGKTAISLPNGVTFDLNGKTLTLDKSVTLNFVGGTETQPTLITDRQATSHADAGTIKALMTIGSGYINFEKVNVDTTATGKLNTFMIEGTKENKAYVDLSGISIRTEAAASSTSNGDITLKYADIMIHDLNENFGFILDSQYKYSSGTHKIFQNEVGTVTINSGTFTLTEGGADHNVYIAYNDATSSLLYITGGEFYFKNGDKNVKDVFIVWNRYANDASVTGGKFYTENTAGTLGTTGYSGLVPQIIKGGIFNVAPPATAFVTGYFAKDNADSATKDTYPYAVGFEAAVKVGETEYPGIQEAFNAMADGTEAGREIILLKDVTLGSSLVVKVDGVTITKGEYALNLPADKASVTLSNDVTMPTGIDIAEFEAYRTSSSGKSYYSSFATAANGFGTITLLKNVTLDPSRYFYHYTGECTLNLGDYNIKSDYSGEGTYPGLFTVAGSTMGVATLTINADKGGIIANNCYTFQVGGSTYSGNLVINGGNFYGAGTCVNVQQGDVAINGGTFKVTPFSNPEYADAPYGFTINCIGANYDNGIAKVEISGGEFYEFDPKDNAAEGKGTNFLKDETYTTIYDENTQMWKVGKVPSSVTPGTTVNYLVEHYKADPTGYTVADTEILGGEIGKTVTATAKQYEGYTLNATKSASTSSGTLKALESPEDILVLKLYYDVSASTVTPGTTVNYLVEHYKADSTGYTVADTDFLGGEIGETVTATAKQYDGYTLNTTSSTISGTLKALEYPEDILVLKLYYDVSASPVAPSTTVSYIVEHYKASTNGYVLDDTEIFNGEIGETVTATQKQYEDYTVNLDLSISSGTLKALQSPEDILVLKLYYDVDYTIIEGTTQTVTMGNPITFVSDADFDKFIKVQVDGNDVDAVHYVVEAGSTKVTLKASYISSLSPGPHTMAIVSSDGTASTTFTVMETPSSSSYPQGSSTWLTEPLAPSEQPGDNPTNPDQAPTDIPPVQPKPTEPESPLSLVAVLAGLGAVAALRRK